MSKRFPFGSKVNELDKLIFGKDRKVFTRDDREFLKKVTSTTCMDCGVFTVPGQGSTRCSECWDSRFGEG